MEVKNTNQTKSSHSTSSIEETKVVIADTNEQTSIVEIGVSGNLRESSKNAIRSPLQNSTAVDRINSSVCDTNDDKSKSIVTKRDTSKVTKNGSRINATALRDSLESIGRIKAMGELQLMKPQLVLREKDMKLTKDAVDANKFKRKCCCKVHGGEQQHESKCPAGQNNMIRYDPAQVKGKNKERFNSTKEMRLYANEEFHHRQFIPKHAKTKNPNIAKMRKPQSGLYAVSKSKSVAKKGKKSKNTRRSEKDLTYKQIEQNIVTSLHNFNMKRDPSQQENLTDEQLELTSSNKSLTDRDFPLQNQIPSYGDGRRGVYNVDLREIKNKSINGIGGEELKYAGTLVNNQQSEDEYQQSPSKYDYGTIHRRSTYNNSQLQKKSTNVNQSQTINTEKSPLRELCHQEILQLRQSEQNQLTQGFDDGNSDQINVGSKHTATFKQPFYQQFGLLTSNDEELPQHQKILISINDSNTHSSNVLDAEKLEKKLALMVTQLKNFNNTELKEMMKHYTQLLENSSRSSGRNNQNNNLSNPAIKILATSEESLRYLGETPVARSSRTALNKHEVQNALKLIQAQLVHNYELMQHEYELAQAGQIMSERSQQQNQNAFSQRKMRSKSPNNKNMTYGAGYKPVMTKKSGRDRSKSPDSSPKRAALSNRGAIHNNDQIAKMTALNQQVHDVPLISFDRRDSPFKTNNVAAPLSIRGHEICVNTPKQNQNSLVQPLKIIVQSTAKTQDNGADDMEDKEGRANLILGQNSTNTEHVNPQTATALTEDSPIQPAGQAQVKNMASLDSIERANPDLAHKINFDAEKEMLDVLSQKLAQDEKEKDLANKYKLDPTYIPELIPPNQIIFKPRSQQRMNKDEIVKITALSLNKKGEMEIAPVVKKSKSNRNLTQQRSAPKIGRHTKSGVVRLSQNSKNASLATPIVNARDSEKKLFVKSKSAAVNSIPDEIMITKMPQRPFASNSRTNGGSRSNSKANARKMKAQGGDEQNKRFYEILQLHNVQQSSYHNQRNNQSFTKQFNTHQTLNNTNDSRQLREALVQTKMIPSSNNQSRLISNLRSKSRSRQSSKQGAGTQGPPLLSVSQLQNRQLIATQNINSQAFHENYDSTLEKNKTQTFSSPQQIVKIATRATPTKSNDMISNPSFSRLEDAEKELIDQQAHYTRNRSAQSKVTETILGNHSHSENDRQNVLSFKSKLSATGQQTKIMLVGNVSVSSHASESQHISSDDEQATPHLGNIKQIRLDEAEEEGSPEPRHQPVARYDGTEYKNQTVKNSMNDISFTGKINLQKKASELDFPKSKKKLKSQNNDSYVNIESSGHKDGVNSDSSKGNEKEDYGLIRLNSQNSSKPITQRQVKTNVVSPMHHSKYIDITEQGKPQTQKRDRYTNNLYRKHSQNQLQGGSRSKVEESPQRKINQSMGNMLNITQSPANQMPYKSLEHNLSNIAEQFFPDANTSVPALYENPLLLQNMNEFIGVNKSAEEIVDHLMNKSNQFQQMLSSTEIFAHLARSNTGQPNHHPQQYASMQPGELQQRASVDHHFKNLNQTSKKVLMYNPLRRTDSQTLRKIHSSHKVNGDEFSVAEMSAQAMLDIENNITEQSNKHFSIEHRERKTGGHSIQSQNDTSIHNFDLEIVVKNAQKKQDMMNNTQKINSTSQSHAKLIQTQKIAMAVTKPKAYMQKYLTRAPSADFYRFKRQQDLDIIHRHQLNDKLAMAVKQDFCLIGKKLNSIKQNMMEQSMYANAHERLDELKLMYQRSQQAQISMRAPEILDNLRKQYEAKSKMRQVQISSKQQMEENARTLIQINQLYAYIAQFHIDNRSNSRQGHRNDSIHLGNHQSPMMSGKQTLYRGISMDANAVILGSGTKTSNRMENTTQMRDQQNITVNTLQGQNEIPQSASPDMVGGNDYQAALPAAGNLRLNQPIMSGPGSPLEGHKGMSSGAPSASGYAVGGLYFGQANDILQSPRMEHLSGFGQDNVKSYGVNDYTIARESGTNMIETHSQEASISDENIVSSSIGDRVRNKFMPMSKKSQNDSKGTIKGPYLDISRRMEVIKEKESIERQSLRMSQISRQSITNRESSDIKTSGLKSAMNQINSVREDSRKLAPKIGEVNVYSSGQDHIHKYSHDLLKNMATINESEQNMSSYHITRPVMNGEVSQGVIVQQPSDGENKEELRQKQLINLQSQINSERESKLEIRDYNKQEAGGEYDVKPNENVTMDMSKFLQGEDLAQNSRNSPIKNPTIKVLSKNTSGQLTVRHPQDNQEEDMVEQITLSNIINDKGRYKSRSYKDANNKGRRYKNMLHSSKEFSSATSTAPFKLPKQFMKGANNDSNNVTSGGVNLKDNNKSTIQFQTADNRTIVLSFDKKGYGPEKKLETTSTVKIDEVPISEMQSQTLQSQRAFIQTIDTVNTKKTDSIFDEDVSRKNLLINKTSRLNQRLMKGKGGFAKNVVGSAATSTQEKVVIPSQRRVNYLVKNPTQNELTNSRLVENSYVLQKNWVNQMGPSAIQKDTMKESFGYQEKTGIKGERHGLERGGLVPKNADALRSGDLNSADYEVISAGLKAAAMSNSRSDINLNFKSNRIFSAVSKGSNTHASTGIYRASLPDYPDQGQDIQLAKHLQKQIDQDQRQAYGDSNLSNQRARPQTAKVRAENRRNINIKPNARVEPNHPVRIESAHPAMNKNFSQVNNDYREASSNNLFGSQKDSMKIVTHPGQVTGVLSKVSGVQQSSPVIRVSQRNFQGGLLSSKSKNHTKDGILSDHTSNADLGGLDMMTFSDNRRTHQQTRNFGHTMNAINSKGSHINRSDMINMRFAHPSIHYISSEYGDQQLKGTQQMQFGHTQPLAAVSQVTQMSFGKKNNHEVFSNTSKALKQLMSFTNDVDLAHLKQRPNGIVGGTRPQTGTHSRVFSATNINPNAGLAKTRPISASKYSSTQPMSTSQGGRRLKKGKVFKDEHFEAKRRDGKHGIIVKNY